VGNLYLLNLINLSLKITIINFYKPLPLHQRHVLNSIQHFNRN